MDTGHKSEDLGTTYYNSVNCYNFDSCPSQFFASGYISATALLTAQTKRTFYPSFFPNITTTDLPSIKLRECFKADWADELCSSAYLPENVGNKMTFITGGYGSHPPTSSDFDSPVCDSAGDKGANCYMLDPKIFLIAIPLVIVFFYALAKLIGHYCLKPAGPNENESDSDDDSCVTSSTELNPADSSSFPSQS